MIGHATDMDMILPNDFPQNHSRSGALLPGLQGEQMLNTPLV